MLDSGMDDQGILGGLRVMCWGQRRQSEETEVRIEVPFVFILKIMKNQYFCLPIKRNINKYKIKLKA